jgi:hypothetical protein
VKVYAIYTLICLKNLKLNPFRAWAKGGANIPYKANMAMEITHL